LTSPAAFASSLTNDGTAVSRSQLQPQDWFDRINSMFHAPTQRPWCDRLQRPSTIVDPRTADAAQMGIARYWTPRDRYLDTLWSYRTGDPPLPQIKAEYHEVFRHVLRKARSNYAPMCIAAMLDRLEVQDISTLIDQDTDGDDLAADIMDETGFIAVSKDWFDQGLSMGESYAMVVPGVEGQSEKLESTGKPCPSIHAIDPRRCIGIPDLNNPVRLSAAVVHQYDPMLGSHMAYLFLPGWKWTLNWDRGVSAWNLSDVNPERIEGLDALGGIPIVRFENLNGLGEYEPHLDLLDRINDVTLQRIIGFWYQALRQRGLVGDEDEEDEDSPEKKAPPVDLNKVFRAGPGELWQIPADFKIWESQQTDFGPLLNGKRDDVKEFAAVTSTPLHLITPDAANGSAQGAGLLREALTAKVRDRRARFTPPLKLLWRMVFAMSGAQDRGRRMKLHWGPIEFHTLAEQASASAQAQGTLSTEDRCERIWDLSPDETKQNMTRLTTDGLMGLPLTPTNPSTAPTPAPVETPAAADVGAA
jgi:hypothetical protein